jgi:2-iminobutanoate/2-iminopropanoate deaminase
MKLSQNSLFKADTSVSSVAESRILGLVHKSPAFSQAVMAEGGKTLYIGGQNGILPDGTTPGDTLASQTEQAYKNILEVLKAANASQENIVKQTIYVVKGQDIQEGFAAAQKVWGDFPTAISFIFIESLGVPGMR